MRKLLRWSVPAVLSAFLLSLSLNAQTVAPADQPSAADLTQTHGKAVKAVKANKMLGVRRIEPGKDVEPKFSDPVRVDLLLKIIENVYYGRPLQFPKDGVVFKNIERRLAQKSRGYYREYTVPTPGRRDRGARRIVVGQQPPVVFYYTDDHYRSFSKIKRQDPM